MDQDFAMVLPVLFRCAKWFVITSLVFSIGGHWAVLQTAAWIGMAITYAKQEPVDVALSKTFDGKHPCKLCTFVSEGKKSERKSEGQLELKKLDPFAFDTASFIFASPPLLSFPETAVLLSNHRPPPTPPPLFA
jgi:hypothetical protein